MKTIELEPIYVDFIPDVLQEGRIYISKQYKVAAHLCACGCGHETVTPLDTDAKCWHLSERNGKISLTPSIGNQNFECGSHYMITDNLIIPI